MATTKHKIIGKAMWAKVFEENRDLKGFEGAAEAYGGQYKIDLVLEPHALKEFKKSGSAVNPKINTDTSDVYVTLKRKHIDRFEWSGGQPKVTKADGSVWSFEEDGYIGNGSTVEVEYEVYTTRMANGTRLLGVKVLEHVPYKDSEKVEVATESEIPF